MVIIPVSEDAVGVTDVEQKHFKVLCSFAYMGTRVRCVAGKRSFGSPVIRGI